MKIATLLGARVSSLLFIHRQRRQHIYIILMCMGHYRPATSAGAKASKHYVRASHGDENYESQKLENGKILTESK
jgi:hypothetical protein